MCPPGGRGEERGGGEVGGGGTTKLHKVKTRSNLQANRTQYKRIELKGRVSEFPCSKTPSTKRSSEELRAGSSPAPITHVRDVHRSPPHRVIKPLHPMQKPIHFPIYPVHFPSLHAKLTELLQLSNRAQAALPSAPLASK